MNLGLLTVYDPPFPKRRVGAAGDGGYVICDISGLSYDIVVSGGVGDNITFEQDFLEIFAPEKILCYDGTVNSAPESDARIHWIKKNIGPVETAEDTTLLDVLAEGRSIFLKMDIEGAEIDWLASLPTDALRNVQQIAMEFHHAFSTEKGFAVLSRLLQEFTLVHLHPNNCEPAFRFKSVYVPPVFEVTLVRSSLLRCELSQSTTPIPGKLDAPNLWFKPDVYIDYQPFVDYEAPAVTPIHVILRMCPETATTLSGGKRPGWFTKELAFLSLFQDDLSGVDIHVLYDGGRAPHWVYRPGVTVVTRKSGSGDASFLNQIEYAKEQGFSYNDILYILEDDYLHKRGWTAALREALSVDTLYPIRSATGYVTLYDHPDKYWLSMYAGLTGKLYMGQHTHWRTTPSTTNTFACLGRTFYDDLSFHRQFANLDHPKFQAIRDNRPRDILSPIPAIATHAHADFLAGCTDWAALADSIRASFQPV